MQSKKLETLFNLPEFVADDQDGNLPSVIEDYDIQEIDAVIERINDALPTVRNMTADDVELDKLADKAVETFENLLDLGMNVDSRYAAEIFSVAGSMYGHALTAKQAKINKKLKMVELQLKKAKLDLEMMKMQGTAEDAPETAEGQVLTRNDLLSRILSDNSSEKS